MVKGIWLVFCFVFAVTAEESWAVNFNNNNGGCGNQCCNAADEEERPHLVIADGFSRPPFAFIDADGKFTGVSYEVVNSVAAYAGWDVDFVQDLYTNCIGTAASGIPYPPGPATYGAWYDACSTWSGTDERKRSSAFTLPYVANIRADLFVRPGDVTSFANNSPLNVELITANIASQNSLEIALRAAGLDNVVLNPTFTSDTNTEIFGRLLSGETDAVWLIAMSATTVEFPGQVVVATNAAGTPVSQEYPGNGLQTRKGNTKFINMWNKAFTAWRTAMPAAYTAICTKYSVTCAQ